MTAAALTLILDVSGAAVQTLEWALPYNPFKAAIIPFACVKVFPPLSFSLPCLDSERYKKKVLKVNVTLGFVIVIVNVVTISMVLQYY